MAECTVHSMLSLELKVTADGLVKVSELVVFYCNWDANISNYQTSLPIGLMSAKSCTTNRFPQYFLDSWATPTRSDCQTSQLTRGF